MKYSKYYKKKYNNQKDKTWLSKLLLSIIIVLLCLIVTNFDTTFKEDFKKYVLEDNLRFYEFNKIYKKFFTKREDSEIVSNVVVDRSLVEVKEGRSIFNYGVDYPVEVLAPGIIVYYGDKDGYLDTVIIQGNDGVDIWYSGVVMMEHSLYDYVSKGEILGSTSDLYLTLSILEDGKLITYDEYFR